MSSAAFRRALEDRLRAQSLSDGIPLVRLRKMVSFDRFLARLVRVLPGQWILRGGHSIQLRLADNTITTNGLELLMLVELPEVLANLRQAGDFELDDWFRFEVEPGVGQAPGNFGGARFQIYSWLDGRIFEAFHIDIGFGDPVIDPIDQLQGSFDLGFAGIQPVIVPCYPITQHIAEKMHAYTRRHASGERPRIKDFVDILILAQLTTIDADRLLRAIHATFDFRHSYLLPLAMPDPPNDWIKHYHNLAGEVYPKFQTLDDANIAIKRFLNPVLDGENIHIWDPKLWAWS